MGSGWGLSLLLSDCGSAGSCRFEQLHLLLTLLGSVGCQIVYD